MKPPSSSPKRLDLQGIRAIAIIVVLGFHFYPGTVPNGYLGVDQFFVLSGFLMCMLLKRAQLEPPCSLITTFYSKRFKRILPLYLLIILLSMIALYSVFPETAVETNQESAMSALLFVSNRPKTVAENYFQMLELAIDIFTHTWSLSVEIQFYFMIPIIFLIGIRLSESYQYGYYCGIGLLSYGFSCFSNETVAFNSVFARIWQFIIGMLVYLQTISRSENQYSLLANDEEKLLEDSDKDTDKEILSKSLSLKAIFGWQTSNVLIAILIFSILWPLPLSAGFMRPFITIITGVLMLISDKNQFLSNPILTYVGDISYSLYLIHWPIYAFWKLTADGNQYELFLALLGSIILAIICYQSFEKWYLRLDSTSIGALVIALFLMNVVVIQKDGILEHIEDWNQPPRNFTSLDGVTENMTIDDAVKMNYKWTSNDNNALFSTHCTYEHKNTPLEWCTHNGLKPDGKYKMFIFGNSWTANHATLFHQECGHKARSILQGAKYGCEPLFPSKYLDRCRNDIKDFEARIEKEQPDFGFIFTRYITIGDPLPANVTDFKDDPIYQAMKNTTLKYVKSIKKKLYILDAIPRIYGGNIGNIGDLLKEKKTMEEIDKTLIDLSFPEHYEMARRRHAQLIKDCQGKCVLVDYKPDLFDTSTNTFRYFDKQGFSFFTGINHMSPHGLERVRHVWRDICRKL